MVIAGDPSTVLQSLALIVNNTYSNVTGPISKVGVQYSVNSNMSQAESAYASSVATPYQVVLTNLIPNKTYYYRAVVVTPSGDHVSEIKTFTTPDMSLM